MLADDLTPEEIELALITLGDLYANSDNVGDYLSSTQQEIAERVMQNAIQPPSWKPSTAIMGMVTFVTRFSTITRIRKATTSRRAK